MAALGRGRRIGIDATRLEPWARETLQPVSTIEDEYELRCLVIDGQPLVRLGVRELLADRYEVEEAESADAAMQMLTCADDFDVAIVDLGRAGQLDGRPAAAAATIRALRDARPGLGIVAHGTTAERHAVSEAIEAGATAYVAKSSPADALNQAVDAALESETFVDPAAAPGGRAARPTLTRRQSEILQAIADGRSTDDIAAQLDLSTETVRTHAKAILARLGARDRAHAVAIAMRGALIS